MDGATAEDFDDALDWIIDNFGCWNGKIQKKTLTTKGFAVFGEYHVELYPRGPSGRDDHLVVRFFGFEKEMAGDVSFLGPDGSLIFTQEMIGKYVEEDVLELPPGPRFEDVVARIRRDESTHMDRLTVRFRFKMREINEEEKGSFQLHSVLDVFETSLKISFTANEVASFNEGYLVEYPSKDGVMDCMLVEISSDPTINRSNVEFKIMPNRLREQVALRTSMCVKKMDDSVLRTEESDHVFRNEESCVSLTFFGGEKVTEGVSEIGNEKPWMFSNSLTRDEVTEGVSVFINFKITPSNSFKHLNSRLQLRTKTVSITPISRPPGVNTSEDHLNEMTSDHQADNNLRELSKELMCLFQDQDFCDFQLKCGDVSFPVHRAILSVRSPVFKTMLSTDMREAASGCVDIEGLDVPTLARFLAFLYTGTVEDLTCDSALKLYYAADKYQVPSLKRECVSVLCAEVSVSNVCDILSLANKHRDDEMTGVAHDFILKHYKKVLGSEEWGVFMKNDPLLAVETVTHFAKKNVVGEIKTS